MEAEAEEGERTDLAQNRIEKLLGRLQPRHHLSHNQWFYCQQLNRPGSQFLVDRSSKFLKEAIKKTVNMASNKSERQPQTCLLLASCSAESLRFSVGRWEVGFGVEVTLGLGLGVTDARGAT